MPLNVRTSMTDIRPSVLLLTFAALTGLSGCASGWKSALRETPGVFQPSAQLASLNLPAAPSSGSTHTSDSDAASVFPVRPLQRFPLLRGRRRFSEEVPLVSNLPTPMVEAESALQPASPEVVDRSSPPFVEHEQVVTADTVVSSKHTESSLVGAEAVLQVVAERQFPETELLIDGDSEDRTPMDLGTVLSLVGGQHPAVGFAQWRVQQAYAEQQRAETLWLPSIQAGVSFHNHAGNLQASSGVIQDINRSSMQAGFGTGAVGAGTTPNPGLVARFHLADAMYAPSIAEKNAWAQGHAVTTALNDQLLEASLAWLELLSAEQRVAVLQDSLHQTESLAKITRDFAEAGQGPQSDSDRMTTEVSLVRNRLVTAQEQSVVASARLVQATSAQTGQRIVPAEQNLVPITLVDVSDDPGSLIAQGLHYRPELKEAQCLVAAACEQFHRQKYAPFVPSVLLGLSQTGFGGGLGSSLESISGRTDFDAALTWELRGLGYGEQAARRSTAAQMEQARFRQVRLMDQVAREITEAHAQVHCRRERIIISEQGITSAEDSVRRNLDRVRHGQGLPIEALQSVRALEEARLALVTAITDYNAAQFQLHRATGCAVFAPPVE